MLPGNCRSGCCSPADAPVLQECQLCQFLLPGQSGAAETEPPPVSEIRRAAHIGLARSNPQRRGPTSDVSAQKHLAGVSFRSTHSYAILTLIVSCSQRRLPPAAAVGCAKLTRFRYVRGLEGCACSFRPNSIAQCVVGPASEGVGRSATLAADFFTLQRPLHCSAPEPRPARSHRCA